MSGTPLRRYALIVALASVTLACGSNALAKGKSRGNSSKSNKNANSAPTTPPASQPSGATDSELQKDQMNLSVAETKARTSFESSSVWTSAQTALADAQSDYDKAAAPVLANVQNQSSTKVAQANVEKAESDLSGLRDSGTGTPAQMTSAAANALAARTALRAAQTDALNADPAVSTAKQKLSTTVAAMADLHEKEIAAVQADPACTAAEQKLASDRASLASSSK